MPARYTFEIDENTRSIRVSSSGTWNADDVERYTLTFCDHLAVARERFGCARVPVDGRTAATEDPEVGRRLGGLAMLFDQPGDRFAVVTPSSLRKLQVTQRGLPGAGMAFISADAAATWLFAHDEMA